SPAKEVVSQKLTDSIVRVNVKLLDKIMNVVGELVINRNQILQYSKNSENSELSRFAQQLNVITTELQTDIMTTRMQPVSSVFNKFERVVRDLSRSQNKNIALEISGKDTELDKTLIEVIKDPLTHLVRNCIDHGIELPEDRKSVGKSETGKIFIKAYHEGGQVIIEISDDGKGLDTEVLTKKAIERGLFNENEVASLTKTRILNVIFNPGFSTAAQVTNISGRGVGMDVVRSNIERIGGGVEINSELGKGTSFRLKIPLTLAIVPALVIESGGETFAIHQKNLVELVMLDESEGSVLESLHGNEFYRLRGELIPIVRLNKILNYESKNLDSLTLNIIVLKAEGRVYGLVVDDVLDTQEIVVKPLSRKLKNINIYAGATIMGDGKVALIVDALGFYNLVENKSLEKVQEDSQEQVEETVNEDQQEILLFELGDGRTYGVPLSLINRLEEFKGSSIESSGSQDLIRYRDISMPLVNFEKILQLDGQSELEKLKGKSDKFNCIVIDIQDHSFGFVVDSIHDIALSEAQIETNTIDRDGLLGTLYINDKLITLIDIHKVIEQTVIGKKLFGEVIIQKMKGKLLLAEDSSLYRNVQEELFKSCGLEVLVAKNGKEGLKLFKDNPDINIVVTDIEMPYVTGFELAKTIRETNANIPIIAVSTRISQKDKEAGVKAGFSKHLQKLNKVEVLDAIKEYLE
ncbi:chemotaxis protein CheW, partial [Bacteriovoracaceae bacterium]|nr:chemotaxis protein CheW [Bacteriovoracaceae bacterium]